MKDKIRIIIEDNTTRKGRIFDYFIQVLILTSLLAFTIETLPNISNNTAEFLKIFEIVCIVVFTLEYVLRLYVAKNPLKYVFSFYGIIDFLAIFPFYLRAVYDLRALRIFRVFRKRESQNSS